jgi:hypothetical protein
MPINWYAALVVIVLVGIASVAVARYHYVKSPPAVEPFVGQTWHAALAIDICGKEEPALTATASSGSGSGLTTTGNGVLLIAPKVSSEAGNNATLGKFAKEDGTLTLTNTSVQYPGDVAYKNGQKCAAGTPDAGKVGVVRARWWILKGTNQVGGVYTSTPASLKLRNSQLITLGFGPSSATLPKVPASTEKALQQTINGTSAPLATTTTTTAATTTTTAPSGTTTTTKSSG